MLRAKAQAQFERALAANGIEFEDYLQAIQNYPGLENALDAALLELEESLPAPRSPSTVTRVVSTWGNCLLSVRALLRSALGRATRIC